MDTIRLLCVYEIYFNSNFNNSNSNFGRESIRSRSRCGAVYGTRLLPRTIRACSADCYVLTDLLYTRHDVTLYICTATRRYRYTCRSNPISRGSITRVRRTRCIHSTFCFNTETLTDLHTIYARQR
jgi:hypothetical protein